MRLASPMPRPAQPARRRGLTLATVAGVLLGLLAAVGYFGAREVLHLQHRSRQLHRRLSAVRQQQEEAAGQVQKERVLAETQLDDTKSELSSAKLRLAVLEQENRQLAEKAARADSAADSAALLKAQLEAARQDAAGTRAKLAGLRESLLGGEEGARGLQSNSSAPAGVAAPGNRHTPWGPSAERDSAHPELAALLRKVAVGGEVMVAISNANYAGPGGMLDTWIEGVQRSNVSNAMVVALDAATLEHVRGQGLAAIQMQLEIPRAQAGVGSNHAVSGLKFRILRRFAELGYAVLLSDVDIVTLRDPFPHLARDSDVEGMSDGWDNATAYGYNDVKDDERMGWARYAHSMRVFCMNSGLFYLRPTQASLDLLDTVTRRLDTEPAWDQAVFNEVIFFPSRPGYRDPAVTRRILDFRLFMNSKVLFTEVRHRPELAAQLPVTVHVNYHPDKHPRMLAVVDFYVNGVAAALRGFPDGSE